MRWVRQVRTGGGSGKCRLDVHELEGRITPTDYTTSVYSFTADPPTPQPGQPVTLTAKVTAFDPVTGIALLPPGALVSFYEGPSVYGGSFFGDTYTDTSGTASITVPMSTFATLSAGPHTITAHYNGTPPLWDPAAGQYNQWFGSERQLQLTVEPPLTLSPSPLSTAQVGVAYSQTLTASGPPGPYAFTLVGAPAWLTVTPGGVLSGTPTAAGLFTFEVDVADGYGHTTAVSTSVNVSPAPPPVTISPAELPAAQVGESYSQTLTASGPPGVYAFALTSGSLPPGLTLGNTGGPAATLTGTPTKDGSFTFTVSATSIGILGNSSSGTASYTLTVNPVPTPPVVPPPPPQNPPALTVPPPVSLPSATAQLQPPVNRPRLSAAGTAPGTPATAWLFNADGSTRLQVQPYGPDFTGGVRVAVGDVDGDGTPDLITAPGPGGGPDVRVFSGADGHPLGDFMAFEPTFLGGVYVAAADLNNDGKSEIVASPDQSGGPRVRVLGGADGGRVVADFLGIDDPNFRGGVRVALGDLTGDGVPDLLVAAGFGGGPRVTVYDGTAVLTAGGGAPNGGQLANFFAFEQTLRNGTYVAAGDLNGDGFADLVFGGGPGGGPRILAWDGHQLAAAGPDSPAVLLNFFAFDLSSRTGVLVAVGDTNGDGWGDLFAAPGGPGGQPVVFTGPAFDSSAGQPVGPAGGSFIIGEPMPPLSRPTPPPVVVPPVVPLPPLPPPGNQTNSPPYLSDFQDYTLQPAYSGLNYYFQVVDVETTANQLQVTVTSSDPGFFADLHVEGTGVDRTLVVRPSAGRTGSATVTVTVTDTGGLSASDTFVLTVVGSGGGTGGGGGGGGGTGGGGGGGSSGNNADYDNYVVISNFKGTYTGTYKTTLWDDATDGGNEKANLTVDVTLTIDTVTADAPNSDPALNDGGNYHFTGTCQVHPFGYTPMTVSVYGTYTCTQYPTTFKPQEGSLEIYTQGVTDYFNATYVVDVGILDWTTGGIGGTGTRCSTNVFDFQLLNRYHSAAPNGTLVLTRS